MKHGTSTVYSRPPIKRRVHEGLLLKFKFNIPFTILLAVTLEEYGIYELSRGQSTKFSCCFSTRSLPSTIPWACERQTIHHHAPSHSRAIDTESDNDYHNPEPGNTWNRVSRGIHRKSEGLRVSFLRMNRCQSQNCQEAAQWPNPANRPLSHFPGALFSMCHFFKATLRAVHWETGLRVGQVLEAQRISLVLLTCRWNCRCPIPDQRFVVVPFRSGWLNFRSFTFLPLANNHK